MKPLWWMVTLVLMAGCNQQPAEQVMPTPIPACEKSSYVNARNLFDAGEYAQAIDQLNHFLSGCDNLASSSSTYSYAYFMMGYSYEKLAEAEKDLKLKSEWTHQTVDAYRKYISVGRHSRYAVRAYAGLCNALHDLDPIQGESALTEALGKFPGADMLWRIRGNWALGKGNNALAEESFAAAIKIDSSNTWSWTGLGTAKVRQGKAIDAASAYREALRISPGNEVARRSLDSLGDNK